MHISPRLTSAKGKITPNSSVKKKKKKKVLSVACTISTSIDVTKVAQKPLLELHQEPESILDGFSWSPFIYGLCWNISHCETLVEPFIQTDQIDAQYGRCENADESHDSVYTEGHNISWAGGFCHLVSGKEKEEEEKKHKIGDWLRTWIHVSGPDLTRVGHRIDCG